MDFLIGSGILLIACILVLATYAKLDFFYKLQGIMIIYATITETLGFADREFQVYFAIDGNNLTIYNIYIFVEFFILSFVAYRFMPIRNYARVFYTTIIIFVPFFFIELFLGNFQFVTYTMIYSYTLMTIQYTLLVYFFITDENSSKLVRSRIWLCLGIVLYAASNIPLFSINTYLYSISNELSEKLHGSITITSANIRYLLFLVSLILFLRLYKQQQGSLEYGQ